MSSTVYAARPLLRVQFRFTPAGLRTAEVHVMPSVPLPGGSVRLYDGTDAYLTKVRDVVWTPMDDFDAVVLVDAVAVRRPAAPG